MPTDALPLINQHGSFSRNTSSFGKPVGRLPFIVCSKDGPWNFFKFGVVVLQYSSHFVPHCESWLFCHFPVTGRHGYAACVMFVIWLKAGLVHMLPTDWFCRAALCQRKPLMVHFNSV